MCCVPTSFLIIIIIIVIIIIIIIIIRTRLNGVGKLKHEAYIIDPQTTTTELITNAMIDFDPNDSKWDVCFYTL